VRALAPAWLAVRGAAQRRREDSARLGALVRALGEVYPIDTGRVFLLGHSRGGGAALRAFSQAPEHFRAIATVGSALAPESARSVAKRPVFLAAGERDFAREGVEAMHAALVAAGSTSAVLKLYPHTEHWLAVTDALPDVFAWFDGLAK
jgi:poly(3-hydroxybutyrate) depolymerase